MTIALQAPSYPQSKLAATLQAHRAKQRETRKRASKPRTWARRAIATLGIIFTLVGVTGASTAQAGWPWQNFMDNVGSAITYFCNPFNVSQPTTYAGIDNALGLNTESSSKRATILPTSGSGIYEVGTNNLYDRLHNYYDDGQGGTLTDMQPSYERYGFSALRWDAYGYGCFSPLSVMAPIMDMGLTLFVKVPTMLSMAALEIAMGTNGVGAFITSFMGALAAPLTQIMGWTMLPIMLILAGFGIVVAFATSRGNLMKVVKTGVWIMCMFAMVFLVSGTSGATKVLTASNNVVSGIAGFAGCQIEQLPSVVSGTSLASSTGAVTSSSLGTTNGNSLTGRTECDWSKSVQENLWKGVAYSTWAQGALGTTGASYDSSHDNLVGGALLNANYVGSSTDADGNVTIDSRGSQLITDIDAWNRLSNNDNGTGGKPIVWVSSQTNTANGDGVAGAPFTRIPFLTNVRAVCLDGIVGNTDVEVSGGFFGIGASTDDNVKSSVSEGGAARFMYNGFCNAQDDSSGVATGVADSWRGYNVMNKMAVLMGGFISAMVVALCVMAASLYVSVLKFAFMWMVQFSPLFLAIGAFGDEKRRNITRKYGELMFANLVKQAVAVIGVMMVSYVTGMVINPPSGTIGQSIPMLLRPTLLIIVIIGLLLALIPLRSIVKGAVRGDTAVAEKVAHAPARAAKTTAKVAAVAALAATGVGAVGAAGVAGSSVAGAAGAKGLLTGAGKLAAAATKPSNMVAGAKALAGSGKLGSMMNTAGHMVPGRAGKAVRAAGRAVHGLEGMQGSLATMKAKGAGDRVSVAAQALSTADADRLKKGERTLFEHDADGNLTAKGRSQLITAAKEQVSNADGASGMAAFAQAAYSKSVDTDTSRFFKDFVASTGARHPLDPGAPGATDTAPAPLPAVTPEFAAAQNVAAVAAQQAATEFVDGSTSFARADLTLQGRASADSALASVGLTADTAAANPVALLGAFPDLTKLDPTNPRTDSMIHMNFAAAAGDQSAFADAYAHFIEQGERGVSLPDIVEMAGVQPGSALAAAYDPMETVRAMPHISSDTTAAERADFACGMLDVLASMPLDHPARNAVAGYTSLLANPAVTEDDLAFAHLATITEVANEPGYGAASAAKDLGLPAVFSSKGKKSKGDSNAESATAAGDEPTSELFAIEDEKDFDQDVQRKHRAKNTGLFDDSDSDGELS